MPGIKKRKNKDDHSTPAEINHGGVSAGLKRPTKKAKLEFHDDSHIGSTAVTKPRLENKTKGQKDPMPEVVRKKGKSEEKGVGKDKRGKKKQVSESVASEDEGGGETAEDSEHGSPSDSGEDDGEYVPPVHESLATASGPSSVPSSKKDKKYVPPGETPDQRDSRTIFVGNVSSQVMATKVCWRCVSLAEMPMN